MFGKNGVYLLIFLLVSASTDDLWAAAVAPAPQMPAADEDGEFLPPARPHMRKRSSLPTVPLLPETAAGPRSLPPGNVRPARPAEATRPVRGGPDLLYALMSLQR
jgi:hypothetical protein